MTNDLVTDDLTRSIVDLVSRVEELLRRQASNPYQRMLIALAGVPGSGKSTISHALLHELAVRGINDVAIVPMVSPNVGKNLRLPSLNRSRRTASTIPRKSFRRSKIP